MDTDGLLGACFVPAMMGKWLNLKKKRKENLNLIRDQKMLKEDMFLMFCLEEGFMPNLPELDNSLLAHKHD